MFFEIVPVLITAFSSALIWDFFFIPPFFTFHVESTEDSLMLLMYFIIALVNAVLTYKIRQIEKEVREKENKANIIKLYNTLLNSLSHELRTPISTIIGVTDNLINNSNKLSEENKKELLSDISLASIRLNRQVGNLLNMSRLESGVIQLKKDWCDINELIYSSTNKLQFNTDKHIIDIQIDEKFPLFKLDYGIMEQVIYNLVHNAIVHTPKGTTISIRAYHLEENFLLKIYDNGPGFPEKEIEKVFDKFYRLNETKTGGTGLGLSIVKGFIEAHQGKINLENMTNGGALFNIEIPSEVSYIKNLKNE